MHRWRLAGLCALLVAALIAWIATRSPAGPSPGVAPAVSRAEMPVPQSDNPTHDAAPPAAGKVTKKHKVGKAERDALRDQIARALAAREQRDATPQRDAPRGEPQDEPAAGPGTIKDRTGRDLGGLVSVINEDFMPLADECYAQAHEEDPSLRGMLDLNVEIIADEEIGGLVDTIELGAENELHSASMTECIRETMLSTVFPAPQSGQEAIRLTLRFEPDAEP